MRQQTANDGATTEEPDPSSKYGSSLYQRMNCFTPALNSLMVGAKPLLLHQGCANSITPGCCGVA